ncbi:Suppressor of G2 allele of SKP1 [Wickerhamomyces ciferrii]|uniref:Suppressor of G2 allele of SKP1 n=1 Tax=Wickerhamomyces ciferrii (strain ATCC 14091 / BCRC 22168 / CBS 111 / JCM 3599 / NBRC 0793 / NRRL Y-1031 F-60-10) TaxID=1206466 RepID=K0KPA8_WICCF|nr:Suppressor of G2 allele of SKP1 [Wickerhamomyces ciferrii]CCH44766.1 Suppressor of G2 allele of SKP1 [Wickerhamomyces ciferrii]
MAIDKIILNGNKLLDDQQLDEALVQFELALKENPNAFKALIGKATALQRLKKYDETFKVLGKAGKVAKDRGNRTHLATVFHKYFLYYYNQNELQLAIEYLNLAKKYSFDKQQVELWFIKLHKKADKLELKDLDWTAIHNPDSTPSSAGTNTTTSSSQSQEQTQTQPQTPSTFKGKGIRLDMLQQGDDKVIINIFIDKVPKDEKLVNVEFTETSVSIDYPTKNSSEFQYEIDPLFAKIDPKSSNFLVNETTIQLILVKVDTSIDWTQIEQRGQETTQLVNGNDESNKKDESDSQMKQAILNPTKNISLSENKPKPIPIEEISKPSGIAYPSSAKNARDWSKFEIEDDDEEEGGEDAFFKKIYAGASEEGKRAMMKSYLESNGTALSTNWDEVGSKKVETSPPDGLEAKKW